LQQSYGRYRRHGRNAHRRQTAFLFEAALDLLQTNNPTKVALLTGPYADITRRRRLDESESQRDNKRRPNAILDQDRFTMIIRSGFQTVEFQRPYELPRPLTFTSHDEAVRWLKQLGFHSQGIPEVRECLGHFSDDREFFRLTDHEVVERMADLLYSAKVLAVVREQGGRPGSPTPKTPVAAPAFPLSERTQRARTSTPKPAPAEDPPTFNPRLDSVVQAAALVAAAENGMPFCPQ
jgi:hypothetical protein